LTPHLQTLRNDFWKRQGYQVIVAGTASNTASRCLNRKIDLVLIGSSLSAEQKRRVWAEYRNQCSSILELYRDGSPELMDDARTYVHHPVTSVDFVQAVEAVLTNH